MGYRSNGGMVIYGPKDVMTVHLFRLKVTKTHGEAWTTPEVRVYEYGGLLVWHLEYEGWKWYSGFDDVKEFERIWSESSEQEELSGYRWRFGEDDNDIERDAFGEPADNYDDFNIVVERFVHHRFQGEKHGAGYVPASIEADACRSSIVDDEAGPRPVPTGLQLVGTGDKP